MDIRCGDRITFRVRMAASFQIFILYGIEGGNEPDLGSVITQPDFPSVEILESFRKACASLSVSIG